MQNYQLLGRSGLRVSPFALGAMTFGTEWGFGVERDVAQSLLDVYLDSGGNFIDTADMYTNGTSEQWLGQMIADAHVRDRVVLASKYSYNAEPGNPNAGGNHRKNLLRALEGSLKRLGTDYIDLYYLHTWDRLTPVDEVMRAMDDAVRAGKIRYVGLSDTPAWYAARAQTLAQWRGFEPVAAMQLEYSLIERNAEHEFADLAVELGMGLVPWSPLASGLLSGKYKPSSSGQFGAGRLQDMAANPAPGFDKLTPRNFAIVAELENVAQQLGQPMAQVALNWLSHRKGVSSVIVGATKPEQLRQTLQSNQFEIPPELVARLDVASAPATAFPYYMFADNHQHRIHGNVPVHSQPAGYAPATKIVTAP
ncbi:aldo/keto reductase [Amantichitinum ursilacus]|uniref:L-glyceraldehyde 3-phosphate reductase n=1 Tax=Amantichitinum ursilacus TaxID=857265 RepID=A0A0N0XK47_9NEIS|nr:aldo/keto reductase [Amantichitinum ursilacus]KPC53880.1 L-glyceraldehyde 3-phosphate reductase [Amantichitinum ursilacus]